MINCFVHGVRVLSNHFAARHRFAKLIGAITKPTGAAQWSNSNERRHAEIEQAAICL
jgi:hypothetical protein